MKKENINMKTEENYFVISFRLFSFDISFDTINIIFIKNEFKSPWEMINQVKE
jgi:hypothetical protein